MLPWVILAERGGTGMEFYALVSSLFLPPIIGAWLLRKAGCGWGRVLFGAAMCWAVAFAVLIVLFAASRRHGWDMDSMVVFLPALEVAVFAYLIWTFKNGPQPAPDPATAERERRQTNRTIIQAALWVFLAGVGGVIAKAFLGP